jgi:sulfate adenylyltransferase subunit 2
VFPISNWTELDVWQYIHLENIPIVPLYFAAERPVVERDGTLIMVDDERMRLRDRRGADDAPKVRFRTLGLLPAVGRGGVDGRRPCPRSSRRCCSPRTSERQGRMIDHDEAASMEKKKQEGYF